MHAALKNASCTTLLQVVSALLHVLEFQRVRRVSVVAHSYGTFYASRLVQRAPQAVAALTLIDPVTFNMVGACFLMCSVLICDGCGLAKGQVMGSPDSRLDSSGKARLVHSCRSNTHSAQSLPLPGTNA